ncbi:ribokinase [Tersicoccus solisilvae]|uniref:Ribokinase n=1 Tax=Tersicoccus solisilvae TaxID=1882339 RepID=A0ABQ1NIM1_9MICC|nr:ribokinase [Tersicoccus solisilvae]GGC78071.1 ribokinase [Tersicoccus solisilvae]
MNATPSPAGTPADAAADDRAVIAVVGSINADLFVRVDRHPNPGETVLGTGGSVSSGGKGANQAVAAARLGAAVRLVGAVGRDSLAEQALALLDDAGVDLSTVAAVEGPTGLAVVEVDRAGENSIVVVPGANAAVDAAMVDAAADVVRSAAIVVIQGEIPLDGIERAARLCTGRLIFNTAPVPEDVDLDIVRAADPLVVNEHEGVQLLDQLDPPSGAPGDRGHRDLEAAQVVQRLRDTGVRSVVMTLGGAGALVTQADTIVPVLAPTIDAVDTTGAGDAFVGALAMGLARGDDLLDAARVAARVGAFACRAAGAQPSYPWAADTLPDV